MPVFAISKSKTGGFFLHKPLEPRTVGTILDDTFRQFRIFFVPALVISITLYGLYNLLEALIFSFLPSSNFYQSIMATLLHAKQAALPATTPSSHEVVSVVIGSTLIALLSLIAINTIYPLMQTVYALMIKDHFEEKPKETNLFTYLTRALPYWGRYVSTYWLLLGLSALAIVILMIIGIILGILFAAIGHSSASVFGVLIVIVFTIAAMVAIVFFSIRLSMTQLTVVLEERKNWSAIKRSFFLTRKAFWRIFLISVIAAIVISAISSGLTLAIQIIPSAALSVFISSMVQLVWMPILPFLMINLYFDQKTRREPSHQ